MTIEKDEPWGQAGPLAPDGMIVTRDADMRDEVEQIKKTFGRQASKEKCQALFEQHLVRQHQLYPLNWV